MRMLLNVRIPHQQFNAAVKDGTVGGRAAEMGEEREKPPNPFEAPS